MNIHAVAMNQIIIDSISRLADNRRGSDDVAFGRARANRFTDPAVSLRADIKEFLPPWGWILPHRDRTVDLPRIAPITGADLHNDHIPLLNNAVGDILRGDTGGRCIHRNGA